MKHCIAIIIFSALCSNAQDVLDSFDRDCRLVRDAARLNLSILAEKDRWVIAEVLPGLDQGTRMSNQSDLRPDGKRPASVRTFSGTLDSTAITSIDTPPPDTYFWRDYPLMNWNVRPDYEPFIEKNRVLFRYNEKAQGAEQFQPVFLIDDAWTLYLKSAVAKWNDLPPRDPERTKKLVEAIPGKNPFMALAAIRAVASDQTQPPDILFRFYSNDMTLQAAATLLLFPQPDAPRLEKWKPQLLKRIDAAKHASEFAGLAFGLVITRDKREWAPLLAGDELLDAMDRRCQSFSEEAQNPFIKQLLINNRTSREFTRKVSTQNVEPKR